MKSRIWKSISVVIVLSLLLAACGSPAPTTLQVTPLPEAPITAPVTGTPPYLKVGDVEIAVTPGLNIQAIPAPKPEDEAYILDLQADEDFQSRLEEFENSINNYLASHTEDEMLHDTVFITGLLGTLFKFGLQPRFCRTYGNDAANHMLETSEEGVKAYRLKRLGGNSGMFSFKENMVNGTYQILGLFASKSAGRAGFMLKIDGQIIWVILSNESRNTIIPATLDEAIEIGQNFFIDDAGRIIQNGGQVFASTEITRLLGVGGYALEAWMVADTAIMLKDFATCLDQKLTEKSESYRSWKERRAKNENNANDATADQAAKYIYTDEADLVADIQRLQALGVVQPNIIVEGENQRQVSKFTTILGGTTLVLIVAPVAIDVALAAELAKEIGTSVILYRISFATP